MESSDTKSSKKRKLLLLISGVFLFNVIFLVPEVCGSIINTATTTPFYPNQRAICRDGKNYIHVAWLYNSTVIKYARSTDNGQTWSINQSFYGSTSTATSIKSAPSISCNGNNITIVYEDVTADDLIIAISTDNGMSWTFSNPITSCVQGPYYSIEIRGNRIYVVYTTPSTSTCGYADVYFFNSSDGGTTWGAKKLLFDGYYFSTSYYGYYYESSLAVNGTGTSSDFIHIVVRDKAYDTGILYNDIYYVNSSNAGSTFGSSITLISPSFVPYYPSITSNASGGVFVTYHDANTKIYSNRSSNNGVTWTGEEIAQTTDKATLSSVTTNLIGQPIVFWQQNDTANNKPYNIIYRNYTGSGWGSPIWVTYSDIPNTNVNTKRQYSANCIEFVYTNGTASPYNLIYDSIGTCNAPIVDTTPPIITVQSPLNTTYATTSVWVNVTLDEAGSWCGRSLDGGANVSLTNSSGNWNNLMTDLSQGSHNVKIYCNDTSGNMNSTQVWFSVDTIPPIINLISPQNTTYSQSTIWLNVTANEPVSEWWYSLNNGQNTTFTPNTTITANQGSNYLIVYANDTVGNMNSTSVYFTVEYPPAYSLNSTNSTLAGTAVSHNLYWQDYEGLSGYIFSFWNGSDLINQTPFNVTAVSYQSMPANNTIDDNTATAWESSLPPHWIVYDLGVETVVTGVRVYSVRYSAGASPCNITVYVSSSLSNWGSPLAECAFPDTTGWHWCSITPKAGRYINLTVKTTDSNGLNCGLNNWLSGFYEFDFNSTGLYNDTWKPFTTEMCPSPYTACWSNVTKVINSTIGAMIKWCVYANDTSGKWNGTSCENPFTYITSFVSSILQLNATRVWWNDSVLASGYITRNYQPANGTLNLFIGGQAYCSNVQIINGNWNCTFYAPLEIKSYTVTVNYTDDLGNPGSNTTALTVSPFYGKAPTRGFISILEQYVMIQDLNGKIKRVKLSLAVWH